MEESLQLQKYMNFLLGFMTFWTVPYQNGLVIQLVFEHSFFILLPGSVVKSGLHSFPFFTTLWILFLLACLYGHINWSVAQTHQQSSLELSQSSTSMRGVRAKPKAWSYLMYRSYLCQSLVVHPWQRSLNWILGLKDIRVAKVSLEVHLQVPLTLGRRGDMGNDVPDVLQSTTSSPSSPSLVQVGTLKKFLDQWRRITSNRFVLNMVEGHHLQLMCHLHYSMILNALTSRLLWLNIPLSRRSLMTF